MPTYEYRCEGCDNEFEIARTMSAREDAESSCPACGSENVRRAFGASVQPSSKT